MELTRRKEELLRQNETQKEVKKGKSSKPSLNVMREEAIKKRALEKLQSSKLKRDENIKAKRTNRVSSTSEENTLDYLENLRNKVFAELDSELSSLTDVNDYIVDDDVDLDGYKIRRIPNKSKERIAKAKQERAEKTIQMRKQKRKETIDAMRRNNMNYITKVGVKRTPIMDYKKPSKLMKIQGKGIEIDFEKSIPEKDIYIPFGNKILNQSKLEKCICMLRYKNGVNITKYPTKSISNSLANILRKMINNISPDFEELSKLTNDEKLYLSNLIQYTNIENRFCIPTPDKSESQKEMDRLKLLIGQLKAGQNSKVMINELKTLLLKFRTENK